jgi:hypothetical protein
MLHNMRPSTKFNKIVFVRMRQSLENCTKKVVSTALIAGKLPSHTF